MAEGEAYTIEEVDALYRTSLSGARGGLTAPEALRWYIAFYGQQGYPVGDATALAEARLARAGLGPTGTTGYGETLSWLPIGDLDDVRRRDGTLIGDPPDLQPQRYTGEPLEDFMAVEDFGKLLEEYPLSDQLQFALSGLPGFGNPAIRAATQRKFADAPAMYSLMGYPGFTRENTAAFQDWMRTGGMAEMEGASLLGRLQDVSPYFGKDFRGHIDDPTFPQEDVWLADYASSLSPTQSADFQLGLAGLPFSGLGRTRGFGAGIQSFLKKRQAEFLGVNPGGNFLQHAMTTWPLLFPGVV